MFSAPWELTSLAFLTGGPYELIIIGGIVLLLFGNRLPGAAKSLGQSFSMFKKGIKEGADDESTSSTEKVESRDTDDSAE